jgi:type VI secretion system secreted protein Hcp
MPTAVEYFVKIEGIDGESEVKGHEKEIDVESWSWGETQAGTLAFGGGAGAGKVQMQDFHFTMQMSKASPKLFLACATGQHIKQAYMTGVRGGDLSLFLKWTLSDVLISSYQTGGASESLPMESMSMAFAKIEVEYRVQREDGGVGEIVKAGWDLKLNQKV